MDNGLYTYFAGLVNQYKRPENGLVQLFNLGPRNIFGGSKVSYDLIKRTRQLPIAKRPDSGYTTIGTDIYGNFEYEPPAYKERSNYAIGQVQNRQAGTLVTDDIDKTMLLMEKTAADLVVLLDRFELGLILQASEIFQHGKIRFNSVYGYEVKDIDFECPASHFDTVLTLWNGGAGDPWGDLANHAALITKNGRYRINNYAFGRKALSEFLKNDDVYKQFDNRRIDRGNLSFENVQMNGFQRIGIVNINGVNSAFWTYDEYYDNDDNTAAVDFIDPNNVIMWSSEGDYQRYYAGIDVIKSVDEGIRKFLPSQNITMVGDRVATDVYIHTDKVNDGQNSGVYLHADTKPLCVPRTHDTFGRLTVTS